MLFTGIGYLFRTITFCKHNHRSAKFLKKVHITVHPAGRCRTKASGSHPFRCFGRSGIVNRVFFEIFRHWLTRIDHLFDLCVRNITGNDKCPFEIQTCFYRIFGELFANFIHWPVQIDIHCWLHKWCLPGKELSRIAFKFFQKDTVLRNLCLDIPVCTATHANTYGARGRMARKTDHPHIVDEIFPAKLCPDSAFAADPGDFLFPFQIPESLTPFISFGRKMVQITGRCFLNSSKVRFRRSTANDNGQMIRRTS